MIILIPRGPYNYEILAPIRYEASKKAAAREVAGIRQDWIQERAALDSKASEQSSHINRINELSNR